ncbi:MAG: proline dehydrogenase family protein [Bacteroidia bacterium]|jgi:proline dehydrogenase|nr:proline dehydrogenase family protein [Bacteroidia bacterium]
MQNNSTSLSFDNTELAFKLKTNAELKQSYFLFKAIGYNWLVKVGPPLVNFAFNSGLPVKGIIKKTVFKQFCGGESMDECEHTMNRLYSKGVGTILDYSVEGEEKEENFEATKQETIATINKAKGNSQIPFCVFKVTGLARFDLLAKVNANESLTAAEESEFARVKNRIYEICKLAYANQVRLFIDAEESWIQDAIDAIVQEMMMEFNKQSCIVYNTIQLYRHDRLQYLKESYAHAEQYHYYYGVKLVRGAYMEKERLRADQMGYKSPIQPDKASSDRDYDEALKFCLQHIERISICAGSHNEHSSMLLTKLMQQYGISPNDKRIYFSQLYGMSDHISFNLSDAGYNVAKYLPYGPVKSVLPYLFRRAAENTSVKGQAGRELTLITNELKRRRIKG